MTSLSLDKCSVTGLHWLAKEDCHVIIFPSNSQHLLQILGLKVLCEDKVVLSVSFLVSCQITTRPTLQEGEQHLSKLHMVCIYPMRAWEMLCWHSGSSRPLSYLWQWPRADALGNSVRKEKHGVIPPTSSRSGSSSWKLATARSSIFYIS